MFLVKKNMGAICSGTVEHEISELLITGSNRMTSNLTRIMCCRLNELNMFCSGNKVPLYFLLVLGVGNMIRPFDRPYHMALARLCTRG